MAKEPTKDLQDNPDKKDAQIKTGVGAIGAGATPQQTDHAEAAGGPPLNETLTGPVTLNVKPAAQSVDEILASQPTTSQDNLAETAAGAIADRSLTEPERFQVDGDNTAIAPMPRNQIDKDPAEDPMRRQPGEIPYQRAAQNTAMEQEGVQPYVMTMPYWDGVAMHPKGTVMSFKPADAPYGAQLVVNDKPGGEPSEE